MTNNFFLIKEIIIKIKNNDIFEFSQFIRDNSINIEDFKQDNITNFDILINSIENDASRDILDYIIFNGKYTSLNYMFSFNGKKKIPLLVALERNNLDLSEFLIEYGTDINDLDYNYLVEVLNYRNIEFVLNHGLRVNITLINYLIKNKKNGILQLILNNYIFNNYFILNFLLAYQSKTPLSKLKINQLIMEEKNKIVFNEVMYEIAIEKNNFEAINLLYNYDERETSVILTDFYNIFNHNSTTRNILVNKIESRDFNFVMDIQFLNHLKTFTTNKEKKETLIKLIKNNDFVGFKNYVNKNKIQLSDFNDKQCCHHDLLMFAMSHKASFKLIKFIVQECHYENEFDYVAYVDMDERYGTPLFTSLLHNDYRLFNFLIEKGANINFYDENDILNINRPHIKFILNHKNFEIPYSILIHSIGEDNSALLKDIFKYYIFNDSFILNLLSYYKNKTALSSLQLKGKIEKETNKIPFNEELYQSAIFNNSDQILNLLYTHDPRDNNKILTELYQIFDNIDYHNEKIKFIHKVENNEIKVDADGSFLKNLQESDSIRYMVLNKVIKNQVNKLDDYIKKRHMTLSYVNNDQFDLLIYSIENDGSMEMIKYIMNSYNTLDYFIEDRNTFTNKSPLLSALIHNKYSVAKILLKGGADINYNVNDSSLEYLYKDGFLNTIKLKFLLDNGYTIPSETLCIFIEENENVYLDMIFKYFFYDNDFILNLLSIYKNKKMVLSNEQLKHMLLKEKSKISLKYDWIYKALFYDNNKALKMLINCCDMNTFHTSLDKDQLYELMDEAIEKNSVQFIEVLMDQNSFNFDHFNIEEFLSPMYFTKEKFESRSETMSFFIKKILNHPYFDFKQINFENIMLNLIKIGETNIIDLWIKNSLGHKTFNFSLVNFNTILNGLWEKSNVLNILNHPSFDCRWINVENLLLHMFKSNKFTLIPPLIETILIHKTYPIQHLKIKKILFILRQFDNNISVLEWFIQKLISSGQFNIKNINLSDIIIPLSKVENLKFFKLIVNKLLNHPTFDIKNGNVHIKDILLISDHLSHKEIYEYFIKSIFNHHTFKFNSENTKNVLLAVISSKKNDFYRNCILEEIIHHNDLMDGKLLKSDTINYNKILLLANRYNNAYMMQWLFQRLDSKIIDSFDKEKLLLSASFMNNKETMEILVIQLLNLTSLKTLEEEGKNNKVVLNLSNIKNMDTQYMSLILNVAIKLNNLNFVKRLINDNHNINFEAYINTKDRNGEYPIIVAANNNTTDILEYLLTRSTCLPKKDIKNNINSILLQAMKNNNFAVLKLLLNPIFFGKWYDNCDLDSPLIKAIYNKHISELQALIENYKNNIKNNESSLSDFSSNTFMPLPLSLSYLLDNKEIFKILSNHLNINELDRHGYSVLHYAVIKEDLETIKYLINKGANVNDKKESSNYNKRPSVLDTAIEIQNNEVILALLNSKGVSLSEKNERGETPLIKIMKMVNYSYEEKINFINLFLKLGSDINEVDHQQKSALMYALEQNSILLVEFLIDHGANHKIFVPDPLGNKNKYKNPYWLKYIMRECDVTIIEYIMEYEPLTIPTEMIYELIYHDRLNVINLLISKTVINLKSSYNGYKLLDYAIEMGKEKISRCLIERGLDVRLLEGKQIEKIIHKHENDLLKFIIPKFYDVNKKDNSGETPLMYAIKSKNVDIMNYLREQGADDRHESHYHTILTLTIQNQDLNILQWLVDHGANVNQVNSIGNTALTEAIRGKKETLVKYLIDHGAQVNQEPEFGDRHLISAIKTKSIKIVEWLVDSGIILTPNETYYPLLETVKTQNLEMVKSIIEKGGAETNINEEEDQKGNTPLIVAINNNSLNILQYLMNHGADIHKKNKWGISPFIMAMRQDNTKIIEIIRKNSCSSSHENCDEEVEEKEIANDVFVSIVQGNLENLKHLVNNGTDLNMIKDENDKSPLIYAIEKENIDIVKYIISCGVDINSQDKDKKIPLIYAIEHDHLAMVNYLIENGADVNYNPPNKLCPLMYALEKNNNSMVRCLIEYGANISIFKSGFSLLMRSIQMKKISLCKYLIDCGDDVNVYNSCCVTPLTLAIESGNMEMVKYLVCHDADIHGEAIDIDIDPEDYEVIHEDQPLIHAIKNKNVTMVNYLLKEMDFYDFEDLEIDPDKKKVKIIILK